MVVGDTVFVADTNNDVVRFVQNDRVSSLVRVKGPTALRSYPHKESHHIVVTHLEGQSVYTADGVLIQEQTVHTKQDVTAMIDFKNNKRGTLVAEQCRAHKRVRIYMTDQCSQNLVQQMLANQDVTFLVDNQTVNTHSHILSSRSEYFKALLTHKTDTSSIEVEDCDANTFRAFIEYLYTNNIQNVGSACILDLTTMADKYAVDGLLELCAKSMTIDDENCLAYFFRLKHIPPVRDQIVDYIKTNIRSVWDTHREKMMDCELLDFIF